jgi:hypothetical protein
LNDWQYSAIISHGSGVSINSTPTWGPNGYKTFGISFDTNANGDINGSWNIDVFLDLIVGGGRYDPLGSNQYSNKSAFNDPILHNADNSYFGWNYQAHNDYFSGAYYTARYWLSNYLDAK